MPELELTDKNFEQEVIKSKVPVLVDFWAPWCGPCQTMGLVIDELAKEYDEKKIKIAKMNIDEQKVAPQQYGIMSIPTFVIFKGGEIADQFIGLQAKDSIKEKIDQVLS